MTSGYASSIEHLHKIDRRSLPADGGEGFNRLIFSKSPYLLQHAENPIDWYPWGEEAFARAREQDRPVLVSIGYSTCHWCHVMAHESFEDPAVAGLLNRAFVAIKVDREERPDLDNTYMAACQMMTGQGGWPLNLLLAPDKTPFFAATYLPRTSRGDMTGLLEVLGKVEELWQQNRARLLQSCRQLESALQRMVESQTHAGSLNDAPLRAAAGQYRQVFDPLHGGFGQAPKFPAPHNLSLLLRLARRLKDPGLRQMATRTLSAIRQGGVYDQVGFGLHRYSVDARWLVPHFEKMLYDQALFILAALEAGQAAGDAALTRAACETADYVLRDLQQQRGGFFCGEDADSPGGEGSYYLWTPEQLDAAIPPGDARLFAACFNVTAEGHFEGKSIPHLDHPMAVLAKELNEPEERLAARLEDIRGKLLQRRNQRPRPHCDDKLLAGWNGLMVAALARCAALTGRQDYLSAAKRAASFVSREMTGDGQRLLRRYRDDDAAIPAFLEDYAFFVWGLLELYQADFDSRDLAAACDWTRRMLALFDDGGGSLFDTGKDGETVLTRGRSLQDGALPTGIAVAAGNLLRLGRLTGVEEFEDRGLRLLESHLGFVEQYPSGFAQYLIGVDYALAPGTEVTIARGGNREVEDAMLALCRRDFHPHLQLVLSRPEDGLLKDVAPRVASQGPRDGLTTAYVCRGRTCLEPVTELEGLARLLRED